MLTEILVLALLWYMNLPFEKYGTEFFHAVKDDRRVKGYTIEDAKTAFIRCILVFMLSLCIYMETAPGPLGMIGIWYFMLSNGTMGLLLFYLHRSVDLSTVYETKDNTAQTLTL